MIRALAVSITFIGILAAESPPNPPEFAQFTPDFRGIALGSDGQKAWAVAQNGFVYFSADGGSTWTPTDVPGRGKLLGIYFHGDEVRGWVVGEGRIAYTTDSGATWHNVKAPEGELRQVILDREGKRGFAIGDIVLETVDGGLTWKERTEPEFKGEGFISVAFSADWNYGAIGGYNTLIETTDGGRTWRKQPGSFRRISKLWTDGKAAVAMSGDEQNYWIRPSRTGKWTRAWDPKTGKAIKLFSSDATTFAKNEEGIFSDGGAKVLKRVMEGKYRHVAFTNQSVWDRDRSPASKVGLAVGERGLVARTEDLGQTWHVVCQWPAFDHLAKIVAQPGSDRIWVGGSKLWRSDDGGHSFKEITIPALERLSRLLSGCRSSGHKIHCGRPLRLDSQRRRRDLQNY